MARRGRPSGAHRAAALGRRTGHCAPLRWGKALLKRRRASGCIAAASDLGWQCQVPCASRVCCLPRSCGRHRHPHAVPTAHRQPSQLSFISAPPPRPTANTLGKAANGLCDNLVTCVVRCAARLGRFAAIAWAGCKRAVLAWLLSAHCRRCIDKLCHARSSHSPPTRPSCPAEPGTMQSRCCWPLP